MGLHTLSRLNVLLTYLTHATLHSVKLQCIHGNSDGWHPQLCTELQLNHWAANNL